MHAAKLGVTEGSLLKPERYCRFGSSQVLESGGALTGPCEAVYCNS